MGARIEYILEPVVLQITKSINLTFKHTISLTRDTPATNIHPRNITYSANISPTNNNITMSYPVEKNDSFTDSNSLGKEAYMFVYNGEPHGLRNRDNMKHWTVHQDEFFDHYLLGKATPEWMEKGVPFLDKGKRDVSDMFKVKETPRVTTDSAAR